MLYWLTTNLWTTGQGLVTRKLMPKPAPPEKRSSRTPAKDDPPANGAAEKTKSASRPAPGARAPEGCGAAASRQAEVRRRGHQEMSDDQISVETTGETVGEAKWSAVRELAATRARASIATRSASRSSPRANAGSSVSGTRPRR